MKECIHTFPNIPNLNDEDTYQIKNAIEFAKFLKGYEI